MTDRPDPARTRQNTRQDDRPDVSLTVAEAAARLSVTPDAIRRRLHRGTLAGTKTAAGEWRVWLPGAEAGGRQDTRQDVARTPPAPPPDRDAYVDHLEAEVAYLRAELTERSRELAAERERFDVLQREALGRIPALTAGQDAPSAASVPQHGAAAVEPAPAAPSWWERLRRRLGRA